MWREGEGRKKEEGKRKRKEEAVTTMLKPIQNILVIKSTHSHANCMSPLSDMHSFVPEEDGSINDSILNCGLCIYIQGVLQNNLVWSKVDWIHGL